MKIKAEHQFILAKRRVLTNSSRDTKCQSFLSQNSNSFHRLPSIVPLTEPPILLPFFFPSGVWTRRLTFQGLLVPFVMKISFLCSWSAFRKHASPLHSHRNGSLKRLPLSRSQYISTGCYKWQGINTIDDLAGSRTVRAFSYWISTTQRAVEKNGGGRDGPSRWGNDPNYKDQDSSYWNWYFLGTVTWGVFLRAENSLG